MKPKLLVNLIFDGHDQRSLDLTIVDHKSAPELPWRPHYRVWSIAGLDTVNPVDCTLHYSKIEPGAGAPLHTHTVDELITVLDGCLEASIDGKKQIVLTSQTMVIPKGKPHGFKGVGPDTATTLVFFPCKDGSQGTLYLDGSPPAIYKK